jgi:hypothetical protein
MTPSPLKLREPLTGAAVLGVNMGKLDVSG